LWHPFSLGLSQDSPGHWGDLMPLEMSPWWFAKALLPAEELHSSEWGGHSVQEGNNLSLSLYTIQRIHQCQ